MTVIVAAPARARTVQFMSDPARVIAFAIEAARAAIRGELLNEGWTPPSAVPFRTRRTARKAREAERAARPRRVFLYLRLSKSKEGEQVPDGLTPAEAEKAEQQAIAGALERQERACRLTAEARGWEVVGVFVDDDRSAYSLRKPREQFIEMISRIALGEADAILVWKLDRLVRRITELGTVLRSHDVAGLEIDAPWGVLSVVDGVDTDTPMGKVIASVLISFAQLESENISIRTKARHDELAKAGAWSGGGTRAFGHTMDRKGLKPAEAEAIREVARRVGAHEPLQTIAKEMAARGVVGVEGKAMSAATWRNVLVSPRIVSRRLIGEEQLSPPADGNPADPFYVARILDDETAFRAWEVLQKRSKPSIRGTRPTARRYLLVGLIECRLCRRKLRSWINRGVPSYACLKGPWSVTMGCGGTSIKMREVDEVVSETAIQLLEAKQAAGWVQDEDPVTALLAELEGVRERRRVLAADRYDRGTIDDEAYQAADAALTARREEIDARLAALPPRPPVSGGSLRDDWDRWDNRQRRLAIDSVIANVVVVRGGYEELPPRRDGQARSRHQRRLKGHERIRIDVLSGPLPPEARQPSGTA